MKKVIHFVMAMSLAVISSVANVEAATEITSLPYIISTQGSYIINKNLTSMRNGIVVKASNVTIDLNGYNIAGNNTGTYYGIYIQGSFNVEIRNGTIRSFGSHGIYVQSTAGYSHRVINVRAVRNKGNGILLQGSNSIVKDCTVSDNADDGILIGDGCILTGNNVYNNGGDGIETASACTVSGNTVYNNGSYGIYAYGAGCTVSGNTAYNNGSYGIFAGSGSTVIESTAYKNGGDGILAGFGCTVKNNTAYSNQHYGISLVSYNLVDGNTAFDNNQSGEAYTNISGCGNCILGDNVAP